MSFLSNTETAVTTGFVAVANTFGAGLLGALRPIFIIGLSVWILLIAYEVAWGKTEDGLGYIITKIFRMFLIGTFALWGWPLLVEILEGLKDIFVGSGTVSTILETQLIDPISLLYAELFRWFTSSFDGLGFSDLAIIFTNIVQFAILGIVFGLMSLAVSVICIISVGLFLISSSVFILLLAIGPFFLLCLALPFTQRFFETFIGNMMTTIFAMGFTFLMINFVSSFFNLTNISSIVPAASDSLTISQYIKTLVVIFASKAGIALLIVYMFYKIVDLAAALGGGLNMGNNMIGAMRTITRDGLGGRGGGGRGGSGNSGNSVGQGRTGGGGGNGSGGGGNGGRGRGSTIDAVGANRSFTGMGISAASGGVRAAGRGGVAVGRFAYNRGAAAVRAIASVVK